MGQPMKKEWPQYRSHKIVKAVEIVGLSDGIVTVQNGDSIRCDAKMFNRYMPVAGDFLVKYEDGYRSFSPRKAFLDGYRVINEDGREAPLDLDKYQEAFNEPDRDLQAEHGNPARRE